MDKQAFDAAELELRARLLEAQRRLRGSPRCVVVIVSGVEAAGKSEVVNRLHGWLDTRGVQSVAFWDESEEERERPRHWRFWRRLPPRGSIGILFGSWYTQPIVARAFKRNTTAEFEAELAGIVEMERNLIADGAVIVKLWFHLSKKAQKKRLKKAVAKRKRALTPWEKSHSRLYDRFAKVSEAALRATDTALAPWRIIDAADRRDRDISAGRLVLDGIERACAALSRSVTPVAAARVKAKGCVLDTVDLDATLSQRAYETGLARARARLSALAWKAYERKRSTVVVFEGWDAAGKGGAIRRMTAALDARLYRVIPVAAPTDEERSRHYLWRFWRHVPRGGYVTIYDRSWYGRVLVERVEGFARQDEWERAYDEINSFEEQLAGHGIVVHKFWLHISEEEQLRRFEERQRIAHKMHKITEEDWRNREKWRLYVRAVHDMVVRCSTDHAPWTLVPANDKKVARVMVVKTLADRLESALDG